MTSSLRITLARLLLIGLALVLTSACDRPDDEPLPHGFDSDELERHYAIYLDDALSGRIRERRGLTDAGAPRMDTRVEMMLPGTGLLYREERLLFEADPPYRLDQRTRFTRTPTGIEHHEVRRGADLGAPKLAQLAGTRELAQAEPGTSLTQPGLFDASDDALQTEWKVRERTAAGHTLAEGKRSDGARVELELDAEGLPSHYRIGRSFRVERTELPPDLPASEQPLLLVPADRSPGDRSKITRMQLELHDFDAPELLIEGPGLTLQRNDNDTLRLETRRLTAATLPEDQREALQSLVRQVRRQLSYHAGAAPPSLEALVADGRGDCYEYASLFAALAREQNLQTRVVTGLAWAGDDHQGFAPHAWNEVRVGGQWISIDPTWNQVGADASRIRFPDDPAVQLDLQLALRDASISIIEIERATR